MKRWPWSLVLVACCASANAQSPLPKTAFGDEGLFWVAEEELFVDAAHKIAPSDPARRPRWLDWFYDGAQAYREGRVQCVKPPIRSGHSAVGVRPGDPDRLVTFAKTARRALVGTVVATAPGLFGGDFGAAEPEVLLEVRVSRWLVHPDDQPRADTIRVTYPVPLPTLAGIPICSGDTTGYPSPPPARGARILVATAFPLNEGLRFSDSDAPRLSGGWGIVFETDGRAYMHKWLAASETVSNGMRFTRFLRLFEGKLAR